MIATLYFNLSTRHVLWLILRVSFVPAHLDLEQDNILSVIPVLRWLDNE
jgi:hypothetical protein